MKNIINTTHLIIVSLGLTSAFLPASSFGASSTIQKAATSPSSVKPMALPAPVKPAIQTNPPECKSTDVNNDSCRSGTTGKMATG